MVDAYINLYRQGYAYSVGAYQSDKLVGGIYGVCVEGIVSGESMYYAEANAGKVCLVHLMEQLHSVGIEWLDTQMITPVVASLGGKEIARSEFISRLGERKVLDREAIFR